MHILFLADASSPHSYRWIKYFSEIQGIKVTWCSLTENSMPVLENVEYKVLDKSTPLKLLKSLKYISNKSPDIIHAHYLGWNGFLSLFFPKTNIVLTAWGSDIVFNSKNWLIKFILRRMIRQSQVVTCDAYHLQHELIEIGGQDKKIKIVMFGIDENLFISERKPFSIKADDSKYIVGSIRNLHPVYDLITLLEAAKIVLEKRNDVLFNIAGSGPDLISLKSFVEKTNIGDSVKFLGRLDASQLLDFYDQLDIYVSTSLSDGGIASSTAEAMLCERPVIITEAAENGYWVENQVNGRLFNCSDSINLAKIINELLDNQEIALKLGLEAKETIILNNSYNNEMAKMLQIYKKLFNNLS